MIKIALFLALSFLATSANALLVNGDFETGNLNGWTTFTTSNGTVGVPGVSLFDVTGSADESLAAEFNVGNIQNPGTNGGGIFQTFNFDGGSLSVSVDIASSDDDGGNLFAGAFSLIVDDVVIDSHEFGRVLEGAPVRSSLSGVISDLLPGLHEFRVLITRPGQTSPGTPRQRLDNASAFVTPDPIPVPAAAWLFGAPLIALIGIRKRKSKVAA